MKQTKQVELERQIEDILVKTDGAYGHTDETLEQLSSLVTQAQQEALNDFVDYFDKNDLFLGDDYHCYGLRVTVNEYLKALQKEQE